MAASPPVLVLWSCSRSLARPCNRPWTFANLETTPPNLETKAVPSAQTLPQPRGVHPPGALWQQEPVGVSAGYGELSPPSCSSHTLTPFPRSALPAFDSSPSSTPQLRQLQEVQEPTLQPIRHQSRRPWPLVDSPSSTRLDTNSRQPGLAACGEDSNGALGSALGVLITVSQGKAACVGGADDSWSKSPSLGASGARPQRSSSRAPSSSSSRP